MKDTIIWGIPGCMSNVGAVSPKYLGKMSKFIH